jgi:hypothetical protein
MRVDEAEWLACNDLKTMVAFLQGDASDRKLRLFDYACCREVWHLLTDERSRNAVVVAEHFADGQATREQLKATWVAATTAAKAAMAVRQTEGGVTVATEKRARAAREAAWVLKQTAGIEVREGAAISRMAWREQAKLFHDVFRNPFRPVTVDPLLLLRDNATILDLAQAIYASRAFDRQPLLADALEDSGCADADLLGHLRGPGVHIRGCWAVDLLLAKE